MSLDFMMVISTFILIPFFLAVYISTKQVNESYALIALVFGLISCILAFFIRPITEMIYLSGQYTSAATDALRNQYLAAGKALSTLFNGTSWILYMITFGVELLISSLLMLKIKVFGQATAWLGIIISIGMFSVFAVIIPETAKVTTMLNLVCTLVWTVWNVLVARGLFKLARVVS